MGIMEVSGASARLGGRAALSEKPIRGCAWNSWLWSNQAAGNIFVHISEVNEGPESVIAQSGG